MLDRHGLHAQMCGTWFARLCAQPHIYVAAMHYDVQLISYSVIYTVCQAWVHP